MDLLISQGDQVSVWQVKGDQASRIQFRSFEERDLCPPSDEIKGLGYFPPEIMEQILEIVFDHYLVTLNFDLCSDLFKFSKSFTGKLYRRIYGQGNVPFYKQYGRLYRTFQIMENIYDQYLSVESEMKYSCMKLTSINQRGAKHQPWDFMHDIVVSPITGIIVDLTDTQIQFNYGPCYGDCFRVSGVFRNGVFKATELSTPVLNIMMVDVFDTLIHSNRGLNKNYVAFFRLLKKAFGPDTGVYVMVKEDDDDNPFITRSDVFMEF